MNCHPTCSTDDRRTVHKASKGKKQQPAARARVFSPTNKATTTPTPQNLRIRRSSWAQSMALFPILCARTTTKEYPAQAYHRPYDNTRESGNYPQQPHLSLASHSLSTVDRFGRHCSASISIRCRSSVVVSPCALENTILSGEQTAINISVLPASYLRIASFVCVETEKGGGGGCVAAIPINIE